MAQLVRVRTSLARAPGFIQLLGGRFFLWTKNYSYFPTSSRCINGYLALLRVFPGDRLASCPGSGSTLVHLMGTETRVKHHFYGPSWLEKELYCKEIKITF